MCRATEIIDEYSMMSHCQGNAKNWSIMVVRAQLQWSFLLQDYKCERNIVLKLEWATFWMIVSVRRLWTNLPWISCPWGWIFQLNLLHLRCHYAPVCRHGMPKASRGEFAYSAMFVYTAVSFWPKRLRVRASVRMRLLLQVSEYILLLSKNLSLRILNKFRHTLR